MSRTTKHKDHEYRLSSSHSKKNHQQVSQQEPSTSHYNRTMNKSPEHNHQQVTNNKSFLKNIHQHVTQKELSTSHAQKQVTQKEPSASHSTSLSTSLSTNPLVHFKTVLKIPKAVSLCFPIIPLQLYMFHKNSLSFTSQFSNQYTHHIVSRFLHTL